VVSWNKTRECTVSTRRLVARYGEAPLDVAERHPRRLRTNIGGRLVREALYRAPGPHGIRGS